MTVSPSKRISRRTFCAHAIALVAAPSVALSAVKEPDDTWPTRAVHIIVPGGAGGVVDIRTRWLAGKITEATGQPVIVDNRPGAGGLIGMEAALHTPADGHHLVVIHQGIMVVNPFVYPKLPYDPVHDFTPVTRLGVGPLALVTRPTLAVDSVAELVKLGRSREVPLTFGSPGSGTPPHLAAELFKRQTGIRATHVPYRHGGAAASDLMGGQIDFEIEGLTLMQPLIEAKRVRVLATTGEVRTDSLPDVPTLRETGLHDYVFYGWIGIAVPSATSKPLVDRIYRSLASLLDTQEALAWFKHIGAQPGAIPPEAFVTAIREEAIRMGPVIREAGLKVE